MSLVPILYTSLLVFGILMIIIVSISYIAFKIRNRNGNDDADEIIEYRPQTNYLQQHQNPSVSTIKVVPTIKRPELRKTSQLPYGVKRTTVINNLETRERRPTVTNGESYKQDRTYESTQFNNRTSSASFKSRLEILNRLQPEEAPKERFAVSGSGTIALPKYYENFRAIQYYSDEEDEYLYKPSSNYS